MPEMNRNFEDAIITKTRIEEMVKEFDPEIQKIFYASSGMNLEAIPNELLCPGFRTEDALESLLMLGRVKNQKMILMRYGIVTGTPMTLEEVANEFGVTKERVRQVEWRFFRKARLPNKRMRIVDDAIVIDTVNETSSDREKLLHYIVETDAENKILSGKFSAAETLSRAVFCLAWDHVEERKRKYGGWVCGTYVSNAKALFTRIIAREYSEHGCEAFIARVKSGAVLDADSEEMLSWLLEKNPGIMLNAGHSALRKYLAIDDQKEQFTGRQDQ